MSDSNARYAPRALTLMENAPASCRRLAATRFLSVAAVLLLGLVFALPSVAGDIYGTVTSRSGKSTANLTVVVRVGDEQQNAVTNGTGRYRARVASIGVGYIRVETPPTTPWQRVHSSSNSVLANLEID